MCVCVCPLLKILGFSWQKHEAHSSCALRPTHDSYSNASVHTQKIQGHTHNTHTHRTCGTQCRHTYKNIYILTHTGTYSCICQVHTLVKSYAHSFTHTNQQTHTYTHLTDHLVLAEVYRGLSDKIINYSLSPLLLSSFLLSSTPSFPRLASFHTLNCKEESVIFV